MGSTMKLGLAATVAALAIVVGLAVGSRAASADGPPYPPKAKLERSLGAVRGEATAARWYDSATNTIVSTLDNATTAFNYPPVTGTGVVCHSGTRPGSPCNTAATAVGADVYGLVVVQMVGGVATCRCALP